MNRVIRVLLLFVLSTISWAQSSEFEEIYTKQNFMIEMRDGNELYTVVYSPKDTSVEHPILMTRTPYSSRPYEKNKFRSFPDYLVNENYIFVYQDVRGKFMSEGEFVNMRPFIPNKSDSQIDESSDTFDTIEWLVNNIPNNNGNVGIYGISYPGFYSSMSLNESHPALKAVSPQAPIADWFVGDDMHHNGAFTLSLSYVFFSSFGIARPTPTTEWNNRIVELTGNSYDYFLELGPLKNVNENYFHNQISFWNDLVKHPNYDEFWKSRNALNYFNNVTPAVMVVGGWYDGEDLYGALNTYQTIEEKNPNSYNILVMGPWSHGGWSRSDGSSFGDMQFGSNTSEFYQDSLELAFFNYHLKNKGELTLPEISVFETGTNKWNSFAEWPPKFTETKALYLAADSKLSCEKVEGNSNFTEYVSDPSNPVPYTEVKHKTRTMYNKTYLVEDQRFASTRADVISFEGEELDENVTLAGEIEVELYVSTSGTDSDWIVKLIDVFPSDSENSEMADYQMLVRAEIMRGKFRNSLELPEPFVPNEITKVSFTLNDAHHTFLKGHKIMVQIQSSWFPLFDRNPQTFCNIFEAEEKDFKKANQRVYHSEEYPSKIVLRVLNKR
jgi:hypothetical protein